MSVSSTFKPHRRAGNDAATKGAGAVSAPAAVALTIAGLPFVLQARPA
jgi:hypothetical protein